MTKEKQKRRKILQAANQLLNEKGLADFTIDEVAKVAGYSKGGVTYYFANKDQLLVDLAKMLDQEYIERIDQLGDKPESLPGEWSRALLKVAREDLNSSSDITNALIAGTMASQSVERSFFDSFEVIQRRLTTDGYDPVLGTIIRLAVDGMYYNQLFDGQPLESELESKVFEQLVSWTEEKIK